MAQTYNRDRSHCMLATSLGNCTMCPPLVQRRGNMQISYNLTSLLRKWTDSVPGLLVINFWLREVRCHCRVAGAHTSFVDPMSGPP